MARWITKWIWEVPLSEQAAHTVIVIDQDAEKLAGFGTWAHVDAVGTREERHIEIAWFGVDVTYQGHRDEAGHRVADRIYATVEEAALAHPESSDDMPFTLVCHVENSRGFRFWESHGYRLLPDPRDQVEDETYYRMVR